MAGLGLLNLFRMNNPRRERRYRTRGLNFDGLYDSELRARYRFGRNSINCIINLLCGDLVRDTDRGHALEPEQQVLMALRFFATGSFLQVIGDTFGVHKSTVSRVMRAVSLALNRRFSQFIKWPTNDEVDIIKNNFFLQAGFPCVIGCIDGTHVRISENFFLAELVKFFHFSLTSCVVRFAAPVAFISSVISSQILF